MSDPRRDAAGPARSTAAARDPVAAIDALEGAREAAGFTLQDDLAVAVRAAIEHDDYCAGGVTVLRHAG